MPRAKIVFLYTEIAGYFLACARELAKRADVLIVRWPVNSEAPFNFGEESNVMIHNRKDYDREGLLKLVRGFNPDLIVCSGWIDKDYLAIAKDFRKKIPVVVSLDNHWTGSWRQRLAVVLSPFFLKRRFTHAWVPGEPQTRFARALGFKKNLLTHFYCADTPLFNGIYDRTFAAKMKKLPRRFLYVARYVEHKGIFEMWQAFKELKEETNTDWELWCIGTGDQWENRKEYAGIKHIGFVQPADLETWVAQTGVYILPSKFEPWGVSVQEFAICGMPLLLSDCVGSATFFLHENGFRFKAGSVAEMKQVMKKIINLSDAELLVLAQKSHEIGLAIYPEKWSNNLLQLVK